MNDLEKIAERTKREVFFKNYKGEDRVVLAEERWQEIQEENKNKPSFSTTLKARAARFGVKPFRQWTADFMQRLDLLT